MKLANRRAPGVWFVLDFTVLVLKASNPTAAVCTAVVVLPYDGKCEAGRRDTDGEVRVPLWRN